MKRLMLLGVLAVCALLGEGHAAADEKSVKCLLLADEPSDFSAVLETCGADITRMKPEDAIHVDLSSYDAYCILGSGIVLDSRLRERLEAECARGKKCFTEALGSWLGIYSAQPVDTTRSRLVVATERDNIIPGLTVGDPVADLLYSTNWLPIGFAVAYHVTKDEKFRRLWRDVSAFCLKSQVHSNDPKTDGSWCRAFDMELGEAYGCPHDVGWAVRCSESGWTNAEILMGLMMPEILSRAEKHP